jgi:hypothetical protein
MANLLKLIEGDYCCLFGYLQLCAARGERTLLMAKNIGVTSRTIRYHYSILRRHHPPRTHCCRQKKGECMLPHIKAIVLMQD